jgi:hypothetical protein
MHAVQAHLSQDLLSAPPSQAYVERVLSASMQIKLQNKIMCGKRSTNGSLKVVPRPLVCFAGRLDKDTTSADLQGYLASVGILEAVCTKLQAKDGKRFNTAAFRVSCSPQYADLFYDEASWPVGCEVRDWYVGRRSTN